MIKDPAEKKAAREAIATGAHITAMCRAASHASFGVLAAVLAAVDAPTPVGLVLEISRDESLWGEGHAAFSAVRTLTLKEERAAVKDPLLGAVLYLAENCAKVVYNASQRPAPFDHDAGWWIPTCARAVVTQRAELERAVEEALFG